MSHFNSFARVALTKPRDVPLQELRRNPDRSCAVSRSGHSRDGQPQPLVVLIHGGPAGVVAQPVRRTHAAAGRRADIP